MSHNINISNPIIYRKSTFHACCWHVVGHSDFFWEFEKALLLWRMKDLLAAIGHSAPTIPHLVHGFLLNQTFENGVQTFPLLACCNCMILLKWCKQKHVWQIWTFRKHYDGCFFCWNRYFFFNRCTIIVGIGHSVCPKLLFGYPDPGSLKASNFTTSTVPTPCVGEICYSPKALYFLG